MEGLKILLLEYQNPGVLWYLPRVFMEENYLIESWDSRICLELLKHFSNSRS